MNSKNRDEKSCLSAQSGEKRIIKFVVKSHAFQFGHDINNYAIHDLWDFDDQACTF